MVRTTNPLVEKVFLLYEKGSARSLEAAWKKLGRPTTLGNVQRQYPHWQAARAAPAQPAAASSSGTKRKRVEGSSSRPTPHARAAAAASSSATGKRKEPASGAPPSERIGMPIGKKLRLSSAQLETTSVNKHLYWEAYKAAHKSATREYAAYVEKGIQRRKGNSPAEVTDGTLTGNLPLNFSVEYADGEANHLLTIDDYAATEEADEGSWCLVFGKASASKGGGKAAAAARNGKTKAAPPVAAPPAAAARDIDSMSAEERKKLMALLLAAEAAEEELAAAPAPAKRKGRGKA